MAIERSILIAAWNMLTNGDFYRDPGRTTTRDSTPRTKVRALAQLHALGYHVTITPTEDTG